jgi:hypothetical protein
MFYRNIYFSPNRDFTREKVFIHCSAYNIHMVVKRKPTTKERTETIKVAPSTKAALETVKSVEGHLTMDSVEKTLLIYRAHYLQQHPEGLLLTNSDINLR